MEVDELCCNVIVRRWEEFDSRKAERLIVVRSVQ